MEQINTFKESKPAKNRESAMHDAKHHKEPKVPTGGDYADRTIFDRRAREFQAMNNPMAQSGFEQMLVNQEKQQRQDSRQNYIRGIQGRDGGDRCLNYERTFEDGPEVN